MPGVPSLPKYPPPPPPMKERTSKQQEQINRTLGAVQAVFSDFGITVDEATQAAASLSDALKGPPQRLRCPKEPAPPPDPPLVVLREGGLGGHCPECSSSMKLKWLFFSTGKCVSPGCSNYYDKKPERLYDRGRK